MPPTKRRTKPKLLSHSRPLHLKRPASLSSKATRSLIRTHHTLEKQRAKAVANGDTPAAAAILEQIEVQGGIETYQRASLLGQGNDRGGDSSRILMRWLESLMPALRESRKGKKTQMRMLEVGALSMSNACSKSGVFEIERIDLHSQADGITQQDFMERPLPEGEEEQFDVISLSLVLNFVPDPVARGEMLKRFMSFLRPAPAGALAECFPGLFLVLPAPCVLNSRYLDEERLEAIMLSLGYAKIYQKLSNKLAYYLWKATTLVPQKKKEPFKKTEIRAGKSRNNFAVVLT